MTNNLLLVPPPHPAIIKFLLPPISSFTYQGVGRRSLFTDALYHVHTVWN